ncbi:MAG: UDP-N-acetylmuramoyl-L-alanyl-D-glutamate--2,6-diaminopimelate ligase [Rhodoferax sp.]
MQTLSSPAQAALWLRQHVTGTLCADSRRLQPGDAFIAWPGAALDARRFVGAALAQGAAACLVEQAGLDAFGLDNPRVACYAGLKAATSAIAAEFFGHPSRQLAVLAVTGTNGKTSTAWWLAQALSALPQARPCGMIGTLGVGRPAPLEGAVAAEDLVPTGLTTPDPVRLQQTLRQFVDQGLQACAIEASSIGIEEHRLDGTVLRVALLTNLTQDHLDYHGSMEAYWQAKCKLFAWPGLPAAVVNIDDPYGAQLARTLEGQGGLDLWSISSQRTARLQACNIGYSSQGLRFDVSEAGRPAQTLHSRLIGGYNVSNLLGVLAGLRALDVPLDQALAVCSRLGPVPGRMECLGNADEPLVAVDYAHTPDALAQALSALQPLARQRGGRLWCVFGCGGDRDASKRPLMGAIAAQKADLVVVTSDNPRSEKPESIIAQILLGSAPGPHLYVHADRAEAIAFAVAQAQASDVLLLAGKGHEQTQEIAGCKRPFSDRLHALQALRARSPQSAQAHTGALA